MGFMDYQKADQVNWGGAVNNLMNIAQYQDQHEMNALKKQQIERENAKEDKVNALSESYGKETDDTKKKDIFNQLLATDPKRAESMYTTMSKMKDDDYTTMMRKNEMLGKVAFGVTQNPTMLDKIFPTLPKDSQEAIIQMGYDPNAPMDANKAKIAQGIGQHFVNMAQDTKTLAEHAFRKEEKKADREFTAGENALNRTNQKEVANIGASASIKGHEISAEASKYATDKRYEALSEKNDPSKMTTGELNVYYRSLKDRFDNTFEPEEKQALAQQIKQVSATLSNKMNGGKTEQPKQDSWKNYK